MTDEQMKHAEAEHRRTFFATRASEASPQTTGMRFYGVAIEELDRNGLIALIGALKHDLDEAKRPRGLGRTMNDEIREAIDDPDHAEEHVRAMLVRLMLEDPRMQEAIAKDRADEEDLILCGDPRVPARPCDAE